YGTEPSETFLGRDFNSGRSYSEDIASEIDAEIREMLDEAFECASNILSAHKDELHKVSAALIDREKLSGEEFTILMNGGELPPVVDDIIPEPIAEQAIDEVSVSQSADTKTNQDLPSDTQVAVEENEAQLPTESNDEQKD
ncbi:MAG: ATP-dependent zinc metalloprotease FtsH, partial [Oscillospiraceae bacterium]